MISVLCLLSVVGGVLSLPVTQPVYLGAQQDSQSLTDYVQADSQPQYISLPPIPQSQTPIYNNPLNQVQRQSPPPPNPPTQIVSQLLLPTSVDRQIQKAAYQIAGPQYAQQIQVLQQQGTANMALAAAQRRAQWQAMRAQQQVNAAKQQLQGLAQSINQPVAQAQTPVGYQLQYQPRVQPRVQPDYTQFQPQAQSVRPAVRPASQTFPAQRNREEELEEYDNDPSYQFGFDVTDDLNTNYHNRKEQRDGNKITGSYSVVDSDGFLRTVTYTADPKEGFKAEVVRKPTDIVVKIPTPTPPTKEQYVQALPSQRHGGQKANAIYEY